MPVRAERGAGARDRKIGAGDDAERAVERYGQDAAQRGQRSPHLGMLHEISEVFVGRKAEPRSRAIDHGVHRIGETSARRHDTATMTRILTISSGSGDAEYRMQGLGNPGVVGDGEQCGKRRARDAQQRNAGGAEQKRDPDLAGGPGRSSAAITSHSTSNAGAIAAAPITVGRDSSKSIQDNLISYPN